MAVYCAITQVKRALGLTELDSAELGEIEDLRDEIKDFIDSKLEPHTTVPLTTVPSAISRIAAKLVAAEFRLARAPTDQTLLAQHKKWEDELNAYIEAKYKQPLFKVA